MSTIFEVAAEDLSRLDSTRAVNLFRNLLWLEAREVGVATSLISVPSAIYVSDGGVDAQVDVPLAVGGQGIIKEGINRFQIKTGDFALNDSHFSELLGRYSNHNELNTRIKSCLDSNGRFVVVLFGWDNPDKTDDECRKAVSDFITRKWGYANPNVEIWRQNQICAFLSQYPTLALEVKQLDTVQFERITTWSNHTDMKVEYVRGKHQDILLSQIREHLRVTNTPVHIHLNGEPGIGKTRLALEVLNADDLRPFVLYIDSPTKLLNGGLIEVLIREDNHYRCILVVDECSPQERAHIWNKLKAVGERIRLFTLYSDFKLEGGDTIFLEVPLLEDVQVKAILQQYGLDSAGAGRWSEFCGGSPRVAHLLGSNLRNNPEDILRDSDHVRVWDRYLIGGQDPNNVEVIRRNLILRCISLFRSFGFSDVFKHHKLAILTRINEIDNTISEGQLSEAIAELRRRHILQGEYILYISPKLLHLYLLSEWFRMHGSSYDGKKFVEGLPTDLADWHREMFQYAGERPEVATLIKKFLDSGGEFTNINDLNNSSGSHFFFALTNADFESACSCLERIFAPLNNEDLLRFQDGRRYIVWALERIVIWKKTFERGARLLLRLAKAEIESYANNATGVFIDLFSPGFGRLAPTEMPPIERLPLLKELLSSKEPIEVTIAISACNKALETNSIYRSIGAEYQGLKKQPEFWVPKTYGELYDYYKSVWVLLSEAIEKYEDQLAKEGAKVLIDQARGLTRIEYLAPLVEDTLETLAEKNYVDKKELIEAITRIIHYDQKTLPETVFKRWEEIRDKIVGSDYSSLISRYVGMHLYEDHIDEDGDRTDISRNKITELAKQSLLDRNGLKNEYPLLFSENAVRGVEFGFDLGSLDEENSFLDEFTENQKSAKSAAFLGGYFAALQKRNPQLWEQTLDKYASDRVLCQWVPELTWRSNVTELAASRILELARESKIAPSHFEMFARGGSSRGIGEPIFVKWIEYLLEYGDRKSVTIALQLFYYHYCYPKEDNKLPKDLTMSLLIHKSLFDQEGSKVSFQPLADHIWEMISLQFIDQYPEFSLKIAEQYVSNFGTDNTIVGSHHSSSQNVINKMAKLYSDEVWQMVAKELGPPASERAFSIGLWLRGGEFYPAKDGALLFFDRETIWKWIDDNPEMRTRFIAYFVPPRLAYNNSQPSLAIELLTRYGDSKSVRNEFHANFGTEGFVGPGSVHFQNKRNALEELRSKEKNKNVLHWIDDEIKSLDYSIEREKIDEEHRGF